MMLTREERGAVRRAAGCGAHDSCPVVVVAGDVAPVERGESYGWVTRTGIPIRHPSAYSRVGWSSMCYVGSDRRVEVGEAWIWCARASWGGVWHAAGRVAWADAIRVAAPAVCAQMVARDADPAWVGMIARHLAHAGRRLLACGGRS